MGFFASKKPEHSFAWDLKENAIVFMGLEAAERGRHDFEY
jgi:hypothetical protein